MTLELTATGICVTVSVLTLAYTVWKDKKSKEQKQKDAERMDTDKELMKTEIATNCISQITNEIKNKVENMYKVVTQSQTDIKALDIQISLIEKTQSRDTQKIDEMIKNQSALFHKIDVERKRTDIVRETMAAILTAMKIKDNIDIELKKDEDEYDGGRQ